MKTTIKISERLTELMEIKGVNGKALASGINVSTTAISNWTSGKGYFRLYNCIKIVNYFNCSVDFLVGRSATILDFTPKPCPPFYSHLRELMKNMGISRNEINLNTSVKSSHFVDWSKGKEPHIFPLIELADYMYISLDELIGRDK